MYGAYAVVESQANDGTQLVIETLQSQQDGRLSRLETALIDHKAQAWRFTGQVNIQGVIVGAQYERLNADNHFNGGSSAFLTDSGLVNSGYEPEKITLSSLWPLSEALKLRVEMIQDNLGDEETERFGLGLTWNHKKSL